MQWCVCCYAFRSCNLAVDKGLLAKYGVQRGMVRCIVGWVRVDDDHRVGGKLGVEFRFYVSYRRGCPLARWDDRLRIFHGIETAQ